MIHATGTGGLGPVLRLERDLVRGRGHFVDDHHFVGEVVGYVLRSPHPHARIRGIDVSRARSAPGVELVLTAADLAGVVDPLPCAGLHPLKEAFLRHRAVQCGYRTPGMLIAAAAALRSNGNGLDEATARKAIFHNVCRCTGYSSIIGAILDVAATHPQPS